MNEILTGPNKHSPRFQAARLSDYKIERELRSLGRCKVVLLSHSLMAIAGCGAATAALILLASAVPIAVLFSLERSAAGYRYRSQGSTRETAKWDADRRRFLVSTLSDGIVTEIPVADEDAGAGDLVERVVVSDPDVAGNASVGILVDVPRGRLLVVYADAWARRHSSVAAYDLDSMERRFLTHLSGPDDESSFADDVAVDANGNLYVTDAWSNKLWKVGPDGELKGTIRSELFVQSKEWYNNLVGLNGIVIHPGGYLLVIHTSSGRLFRVNIDTEEAAVVDVRGGSLRMGDGMELVSETKLVVAGMAPTLRLVESSDGWRTATVTARHVGPVHRIATSATVKDGRVYVNHLVGFGIGKKGHLIAEAALPPI